jgi:protein-S-isoprenylcysteine O-methyltransferase Ste14
MVLSDHRDFVALMNVFGKAAALAFTVTVIVLVVIRRPASSSAPGIVSKAVAFLGAYLSVIIVGLPIQQISTPLMVVSTILIFAGSGFSLYALIWLGRSISVTSEARHLVTGGPYSLVRHPLYLGEEIALIGLAMRHWLLLSFVILVVQMGFQLYRMGFEEQVMRQAFPEYADYARRTKRLVPWIY